VSLFILCPPERYYPSEVHHLAANTLCRVAEKLDDKSQKERGWDNYTFYDDGGAGNTEKRSQVFNNWKKWWEENQNDMRNLICSHG